MGNGMAKGHSPADFNLAGRIIKDICYNNARKYLRLE